MLGADYPGIQMSLPHLARGSGGSDRLSNWPKATESVSGQVRILHPGLPDGEAREDPTPFFGDCLGRRAHLR